MNIEDVPKEQWEELIRVTLGKSRRQSECDHEGKLNPISGCEFCGEVILRISMDLYNRMTDISEWSNFK